MGGLGVVRRPRADAKTNRDTDGCPDRDVHASTNGDGDLHAGPNGNSRFDRYGGAAACANGADYDPHTGPDTHTEPGPDRDGHAHTDGDCYGHAYTEPDSHSDGCLYGHADAGADRDGHAHTDGDCYGHAYTEPDSHSDGCLYGHADAGADRDGPRNAGRTAAYGNSSAALANSRCGERSA